MATLSTHMCQTIKQMLTRIKLLLNFRPNISQKAKLKMYIFM